MSRPRSTLSESIVAEARSWLGTPYHHMADIKGVGVDCGMLLVRIFSDLGLCSDFDPRPYTRDWYMHQDGEVYLSFVEARSDEISIDDILPGDIVLFRVGRCYSHGAVVTETSPLRLLHAVYQYGRVVEDVADSYPEISKRLKNARFFRVRDR